MDLKKFLFLLCVSFQRDDLHAMGVKSARPSKYLSSPSSTAPRYLSARNFWTYVSTNGEIGPDQSHFLLLAGHNFVHNLTLLIGSWAVCGWATACCATGSCPAGSWAAGC